MNLARQRLKAVSRFLSRLFLPVVFPWALIGVLLGSTKMLTGLALVMSLWMGVVVVIEGGLSIVSQYRRKEYLNLVLTIIPYGFGAMIAFGTFYLVMKHAVFGK
jgi:hypothetical protein